MKSRIYKISGMHCHSCEMLLERELKNIKEVERASVSHKKGEAEVFFVNNEPEIKKIRNIVNTTGYKLAGEEKIDNGANLQNNLLYLLIAAIILLLIYLILRLSGFFNLNLNFGNFSFPIIVLIGLVAGISSCMALVGGLVLGISARYAEVHPDLSAAQKFKPHLFFNLGRIVLFGLFGGILGLFGSFIKFSPLFLSILYVLVGIVMLILGIKLLEIFPFFNKLSLTLPKGLSQKLGIKRHEEKEYSHSSAFLLGGLTFFLPCGFTQSVQLYAISRGSFISGALAMSLFALGTAPGLLSLGGLSSIFKGKASMIFFKVAGLAVIIFAIVNLRNGFNLGNLKSPLGKKEAINTNQNSEVDNNKTDDQKIRMTAGFNGYQPNNFTVKKGVPVKWIITAESSTGCANALIVQNLSIYKTLSKGENVIEFTPTTTGQINFSCGMGMYTGTINVIE